MIRLLVFVLLLAPALAEETFPVTMRDGYALDAKLALPANVKAADATRVVLLVHGSGAQSMDEDITQASKDKVPNLVFRDLSEALVAKGFAVLRYHKRAFQVQASLKADPKFKDSESLKGFIKDPYGTYVADVRSMLDEAAKRCPKAKVFLFGHSEGTYTGLQAVRERGNVAGVALLGFAASPVECLVHEQMVLRPLGLIHEVDRDRNGSLSADELSAPGAVQASLKGQAAVLDLDGDGALSVSEVQAGNYSNLILRPLIDGSVQVYEGSHPTLAKIVSEAEYPVLFFHGTWDNQCPVYQVQAMDLVNRTAWKKKNLSFQYFDKLGHALDPRDRYEDVLFRPMSKDALAKVVARMDEAFR